MPNYTHRKDKRNLNFRSGERILYITQRHLAILAARLLPALVVIVLCGLLASYRSIGGQFLDTNAVMSQQFTTFDQILAVIIALGVITGLILRGRTGTRLMLFGISILLGGFLYFRYTGGRTFAVEPGTGQSFDTFNVILIMIMMLALAYAIYSYFDWANDRLILTNQRVIYDLDRLLIRHVQEQLPINDIQSVEAKTQTYLGHWINMGYVKVQSASVGRAMVYQWAHDPRTMQAKIMGQVEEFQQHKGETDFERLVEKRVYNDEPTSLEHEQTIRHSSTPHLLSWLFEANPEFDSENSVYIWHPHWFFLVKSLALPMTICIVAFVLVGFAGDADIMGGSATAAIMVPLVLVCIGWAAWKIEDHRNDRYILTPTQVVDIYKKPFGPESRQSAGLDSLQNITYRATIFGRIFGYGDIVLETAGTGDALTFFDVPKPREVTATIDGYQTVFNKSQKERNMEDTLKLLRFYHMTHEQEGHAEPTNNGEQQNQADQTTKQ